MDTIETKLCSAKLTEKVKQILEFGFCEIDPVGLTYKQRDRESSADSIFLASLFTKEL